MAKTQEAAINLRDLPVADLQVQLRDTEDKLVRTKFMNTISPVKNPLEIRSLRRQKARILTWIRQKSQAQTAVQPAKPAAQKAAAPKAQPKKAAAPSSKTKKK
jgi:large subunit ribosomal protein L29